MNAGIADLLAPPGAGLPKGELLLGKKLFAVKRHLGDRASFSQRFRTERNRIRLLRNCCDEISGALPILIERVRGLEDSSRFWSLWMTLDHLRIVNDEIAGIISTLGRESVPMGKVSIAALKPNPGATETVVVGYEASCDALLAAVDAAPDLQTETRFPHPWFGPLDALGWLALAAGHMGIHRTQIERILQGLRASGLSG